MFEEIKHQVTTAEGTHHEVGLDDLYPPSFMRKRTRYDTIGRFFEDSPVTIESQAEYDQLAKEDLEPFVAAHTEFLTYEEMQDAAVQAWREKGPA